MCQELGDVIKSRRKYGMRKHKPDGSLRYLNTLILLVAIIGLLPQIHTAGNNTVINDRNGSPQLAPNSGHLNLTNSSMPTIYIAGNTSRANDLSVAAGRDGLSHMKSSLPSLSDLASYDVVLFGKQELYAIQNESGAYLSDLLLGHIGVMAYGNKASQLLNRELISFYQSRTTVIAGMNSSKSGTNYSLSGGVSDYGMYVLPGNNQRLPDNQFVYMGLLVLSTPYQLL